MFSNYYQSHYLELSHLACERNDALLFNHLTRRIHSGTMLFVQGVNGVGKSSLLRILVGLLSPSSGTVVWYREGVAQPYTQYAENLIYIAHQNGLRLALTVAENMAAWSFKQYSDIQQVLTALHLVTEWDKPVYKLSAGQQRKLALARLLIQPAPVWILDEPFTAVDQVGQSALTQVMQTHLEQNGLIIASSHQDIAIPDSYKLYLNLSEVCSV